MSETKNLYTRIGELESEIEVWRNEYLTLHAQFIPYFDALRALANRSINAARGATMSDEETLRIPENAVNANTDDKKTQGSLPFFNSKN